MSLEIIAPIIARTVNCKVEAVTPEARLEELGFTSLDTITVLFDLEEAFDIEIPNEMIASIDTVGDILEKLKKIDKDSAAA